MPNENPELVVLIQAGKNVSSKGKPVEPTAEPVTEIDFSPAGGKLVHRPEPVSTPEGEPSIEEKFRDAGVYGETGGSVLAESSGVDTTKG
ncbi:MAG TPA: hypothetical protein VMF66_07140 [Candidatus Acidoferrum sp.]|nr:hypothetical protein [Candidatus Acidoferrum sp.]